MYNLQICTWNYKEFFEKTITDILSKKIQVVKWWNTVKCTDQCYKEKLNLVHVY